MPTVVFANTLESPEFAAVVLALNRNGEWAMLADPPLSSVQRTFALHRAAVPTAKLRLPFCPRQEAVGDHWSVYESYVLFRPRSEGYRVAIHYPIALKHVADVGARLDVNGHVKAMREDDLESFGHVRQYAVYVGVRENQARNVIAVGTKTAVRTPLEAHGNFE